MELFPLELYVSCIFSLSLTPLLSPVELSDDFPKEQPSVLLHSVYHCFDGFPCQSVISDYPYSPRWSAEEMSERIRSVVCLCDLM